MQARRTGWSSGEANGAILERAEEKYGCPVTFSDYLGNESDGVAVMIPNYVPEDSSEVEQICQRQG